MTSLELQNMEALRKSVAGSTKDDNRWGDEIPQELLDLIAQHITMPQDFCVFGAVCKSWRKSAVHCNYFVSTMPWVINKPLMTKQNNYCFLDLGTGSTHKLHHLERAMSDQGSQLLYISEVGSGWFVIHETSSVMSWALLINPLTNAQLNLRMIPDNNFDRMIVYSNPNKKNDLIVLIHLGFGPQQYITRNGQDWVKVDGVLPESAYFTPSFVSHKGWFYAIDSPRKTVVGIDGTSVLPAFIDIAELPLLISECEEIYLVSGAEDLFVCAGQYSHPSPGVPLTYSWRWQLYRLEMKNGEKTGALVKIESLEDGAIFITYEFAHHVSKLPTSFEGDRHGCKCKKNCIYTQHITSWEESTLLIICESNLEDGTSKLFYSNSLPRSYLIPNLWFVPNVC